MSANGRKIGQWSAIGFAWIALATSAVAQTTVVEYIHTDALGSPVATTNTSAAAVERQVYEPYGVPISHVPTDAPGFTGHVEDSVTDLTYMQQRYYDPATARFLSVDPQTYDGKSDARLWGRYIYGFNNPYSFKDPDGRCPICIPIVAGLGIYLTSGPANAPAPGEQTVNMPVGEQIASAIPNGGRATSMFKMTARQSDKLTQRAAAREAKRETGIPTSQQAQSQTNGNVGGVPVGRQQTYEVPAQGGGTQQMSVQVSRDMRGDHAGMPQVEAGRVKAGGQTDPAGRPRIENESKVRVDFDPKK